MITAEQIGPVGRTCKGMFDHHDFAPSAALVADAEFEAKHPRGPGGKFAKADEAAKNDELANVKRYDSFDQVKATPGFSQRLGNCYELAARYVMDTPGSKLVHGMIQGIPGEPAIAHAWAVRQSGVVHDAVLQVDFHPDDFKKLFNPKVNATYNGTLTRVHMLRNEHWGPWDDKSLKWYADRRGAHAMVAST